MNPWIKESTALASEDGYLDKLHAIYNVSAVKPRDVSNALIRQIVDAHAQRNASSLVDALLKLDKFPIDDIYVGFLRQNKASLEQNPETVKRIANRLFSLPVEDVIRLCRQPMVDNRRMGELFHNWFRGLEYPKLPEESFTALEEVIGMDGKKHHILSLDGSRKDFREFANRKLSCGLEKELDILVKVNGHYVIGEAKYFSGFGGHQDDQFEDAMKFLLTTQGNATRIAVLDGVVWLDKGVKMCQKVRRLEAIAMSALLLPRFLKEIQVTAS